MPRAHRHFLPGHVSPAQIRFDRCESALAYYIGSANARDRAGLNPTFPTL
jgi:hypothetical protein